MIPELSTKFRVTNVDLPGFGLSGISDFSYDINTVIASILDVVPEKAAWLGWSLGGLIALAVAIQYPDRITKLMTVATSPCFMAQADWPGMAPATMAQFAGQLAGNHTATLRRFLALQFHGIPVDRAYLRQLEKGLVTDHVPNIGALEGGLKLLETLDFRGDIASIRCPLVAIYGKLDAMVPVAVADYVRQYADHTIVIDKASHAPFLSHKGEFIEKLLAAI